MLVELVAKSHRLCFDAIKYVHTYIYKTIESLKKISSALVTTTCSVSAQKENTSLHARS